MKEFSFNLIAIFGGLNPERVIKKQSPGLEECHNIEPIKDDYVLHSSIISMNATGQDWKNNSDSIDYWKDNNSDTFNTHATDAFTDI